MHKILEQFCQSFTSKMKLVGLMEVGGNCAFTHPSMALDFYRNNLIQLKGGRWPWGNVCKEESAGFLAVAGKDVI